jgi:hypothetical protein
MNGVAVQLYFFLLIPRVSKYNNRFMPLSVVSQFQFCFPQSH